MTLKEYVKEVSDLELEIFARQKELHYSKEKLKSFKEERIVKKQNYTDNVRQINSELEKNHNIKSESEYPISSCDKAILCIVPIVVIAMTIVFHLILRYFVVTAQTTGGVYLTILIMNLIPAVIGTALFCVDNLIVSGLMIYAILDIISVFYLIICGINNISDSSAILRAMWFFVIIEIIASIFFAIYIITDSIEDARIKNKQATRNIAYYSKEKDKLKQENELSITMLSNKIQWLNNNIKVKEEELHDLKEKLKSLYEDYDVIHENYRNLIAMVTIYKYFDEERCYELKGPYGAYNMYAEDVRNKKVIDSIENLSSKVDNYAKQTEKSRKDLERCIKIALSVKNY